MNPSVDCLASTSSKLSLTSNWYACIVPLQVSAVCLLCSVIAVPVADREFDVAANTDCELYSSCPRIIQNECLC